MALRWYQVVLTRDDQNVTDLAAAIEVMTELTGEDWSLRVESEGLDDLGLWLVVLPEQWEETLTQAGWLGIENDTTTLEAEMP